MTDIDQSEPEGVSAAAERMRRYRERRRDGLRCFTLEIRDEEIDALIKRGHLAASDRDDTAAILLAFYGFLEKSL
jgi:hypothetical protein